MSRRRISTRTLLTAGLAISLVLAGVVSYYASAHPDGLEFVARTLGFESTSVESAVGDSPLADYAVRGVSNSRLASGLAGIVGIALVALLMTGLMRLLRRTPAGSGTGER
ncbi:PDGLE domain-containing protein [Nostocoides sp.]|uniref:PDGLE domain-containing protein n=1 Tax=Nostocoides sp. TaxID=1917966 RepID=UPI002B70F118|nr:PDGLE domain-containing protein [Tetrasphaera sp.]